MGVAGLIAGAALTVILSLAAATGAIPVVLSVPMIGIAAALVILTSIGSGLLALRRVGQADPATLLL